jgi:hypothetical protein
MQMRSSAKRVNVARLIATLSFTSVVATGTFVAVLSDASPAWASPKKKKAKPAAEPEAPAPAPAADTSSKDVDSLMQDSTATKKKSNQQIKADTEAAADAEKPEKAAITEPDAWEKPPVEEEKPKPKPIGPVVEKKGDGRNIDIGLMVGWGFETSHYFAVDPYQLGFGIHGAYEFDNHLILGIGYEYFLGSSSVSGNGNGDPNAVTTSANYMMGHAEVGYDFWFGGWILRPSLWVGLAFGTQKPPMASGTSGVITALILDPGLTVHRLLGDSGWFIGLDGRLSLIAGNGNSAVLLFAQFGHRF